MEPAPPPPAATPLFDRELSWVAFNGRVLQEAADERVPLAERLHFLAIFSTNLDEFFRVRVAALRALGRLKKRDRRALGFSPRKLLREIHRRVGRQQEAFGALFAHRLVPALAERGVALRDERDPTEAEAAFLREAFRERVAEHVRPVPLGPDDEAPFLGNGALYLAVELWPREGPGRPAFADEPQHALVQIPSGAVPRFLTMDAEGPDGTPRRTVFFLDDVVRFNLPELFPGREVGGGYAVKLTRDADLRVEDEFAGDLVEQIRAGLERRASGVPSRFLYDPRIPHTLLVLLKDRLGLADDDLFAGGRYHNFGDLWGFPAPEAPALHAEPLPPLPHPELAAAPSVRAAVAGRDRLLHTPYQRFDPVIRFLEEAAADPAVEDVHATLYRVARGSRVVRALAAAAEAGKRVTAFVEVKARFDEANNLAQAAEMEAAGVRVRYSMPGLKVHAKLLLVGRREGEGLRDYAILSTGNFNEQTARVYGDYSLFTADSRLTAEVRRVVEILTEGDPLAMQEAGEVPGFEHLLVAPFALRSGFEALVAREVAHAEAGRAAGLLLKMNALEDEGMIRRLYAASEAGVPVRLLVRGICCLVPDVPGWSKNVLARSIVDRFLEHARAYRFENDGEPALYLASADWMKRNLDRRIEVAFPIYDADLRAQIEADLGRQWADDTKARVLDARQQNAYHRPPRPQHVRAQVATYRALEERAAAASEEQTQAA